MVLAPVAIWAFAEAVLFFLVADVPISAVAVRYGWKKGVTAALAAALAATAGGAAVWLWAAGDPAGAEATMAALPAINGALIAETRAAFAEGAVTAMFQGSLSGVPYKLYALAAGEGGMAAAPFLLASPIVRLPRFLLAALGAAAVSHLLSRWLGIQARLAILGGLWLAFYIWYFSVMPG